MPRRRWDYEKKPTPQQQPAQAPEQQPERTDKRTKPSVKVHRVHQYQPDRPLGVLLQIWDKCSDTKLNFRQWSQLSALYEQPASVADVVTDSPNMFSLGAFKRLAPDTESRFDPAWHEYETNDGQLAFGNLQNHAGIVRKIAKTQFDPSKIEKD